ncbi:MAG: endonuclease domain-containing protein [Chloroflexi bacterium]|nr:endonuclease domain-containing protein [Chloroflexota bacterium]
MADEFARRLRRDQTDAELLLWLHLRDRRLEGHKFRRQRPIGPYVADFVCIEAGLILELDGSQHIQNTGRDAQRDACLISLGYRVLRFRDNDVLMNLDGVKEAIAAALRAAIEPSPA